MSVQPASAKPRIAPAMLADTDLLFKRARGGSDDFLNAMPFPHLLVPGMIKASCCLALYQGLEQKAQSVEHQSVEHQSVEQEAAESADYPQLDLPPVVQMLLWELGSSTLIRHFASLSGTPPLLPDPFLLHGGFLHWQEPSVIHASKGEYVARHPLTDLHNALRLEIFFSAENAATFHMEMLDDSNEVVTAYQVSSGSLLMTGSDNYRMRYRCDKPQQWASLLSYYYFNDKARVLNGEEQPSAY